MRGLAALLGGDTAAVRAALAPDAVLARAGLLRMELQNEDGMLLRAREGLAPILFDEFDARGALFSRFAAPARATLLSAMISPTLPPIVICSSNCCARRPRGASLSST